MPRTLTVALAVLLLVGCGSSIETTASTTTPSPSATPPTSQPLQPPATEPAPTTTTTPLPTAPCDQAFATAAAVDELQDTVSDLYPAALVCVSVADWVAAAEANPGAIDADPVEFLTNVCRYADQDAAVSPQEGAAVVEGPLCAEVNG